VGGAVAIAFAVALWAVRPPLPPPLELPPVFEPKDCAVSPAPEDCLARLPSSMRQIPEGERYAAWRLVDVVQALGYPAETGQLSPEQREELLVESSLRKHGFPPSSQRGRVLRLLSARDPWLSKQRSSLLLGIGPSFVSRERESLLLLASERDWSAPPPALPEEFPSEEERLAYAAAYSNEELRLDAQQLLSKLVPQLEAERLALFEEEWQRIAQSEQAQQQHLVAERAQEVRNRAVLGSLQWLSVLLGLLLLALWTWARPKDVVVGLHRLQLGRHSFPWSEVCSCQWTAERPEIVTSSGRYLLDWHVLSGEAAWALQDAAHQALQRAATLGPVDQDALAALQKLKR
jgi:hypothetical protein